MNNDDIKSCTRDVISHRWLQEVKGRGVCAATTGPSYQVTPIIVYNQDAFSSSI